LTLGTTHTTVTIKVKCRQQSREQSSLTCRSFLQAWWPKTGVGTFTHARFSEYFHLRTTTTYRVQNCGKQHVLVRNAFQDDLHVALQQSRLDVKLRLGRVRLSDFLFRVFWVTTDGRTLDATEIKKRKIVSSWRASTICLHPFLSNRHAMHLHLHTWSSKAFASKCSHRNTRTELEFAIWLHLPVTKAESSPQHKSDQMMGRQESSHGAAVSYELDDSWNKVNRNVCFVHAALRNKLNHTSQQTDVVDFFDPKLPATWHIATLRNSGPFVASNVYQRFKSVHLVLCRAPLRFVSALLGIRSGLYLSW